jgi:hypothetical protein
VQRLLCPITGRTVSLLPDFCLPRRQHGPEILGRFLAAYVLQGLALLAALKRVRALASWHSVAQSLRDGFLRRASTVRTYVARLNARAIDIPCEVAASRVEVARLLIPLLEGFDDAGLALRHHAREIYALFRRRIA